MLRQWAHSPSRLVTSEGTYIVTAGTYQKLHHFPDGPRLAFLHDTLLELAEEYSWRLEAWAVFPNHYHFVGRSPVDHPETNLSNFTKKLHSVTAIAANGADGVKGRQVWFSYRQTKLTYEKSYVARLNYVHQNAVKHGIVKEAEDYPYCSARWFNDNAELAWRRTVESFPIDRVQVPDDY